MIIHVSAFFICVSLGTELRAGAFKESRYEQELKMFPVGLTMYNADGKLVELIRKHTASRLMDGKIIFKLYTKQRPTRPRELKINDASSLRKSGFNPSKPTYIITHGWIGNENTSSCVLVRDAYLDHTDSNVIVVDWSSYSMSIYYIDVTFEVKRVGKTVQQLIKWLYANGLKADDLTLIGHSLGAHVMGLAGYKLEPKVNNIVGLDPALPMFNYADDSEALSRKDAKHVQIIHTNAGGFGYMCPRGHSDFFPNGGAAQPGCCDLLVGCGACSHYRAVHLFAESISKSFVGTECNSYEDFEDNDCGKHPKTTAMGGLNLASVKPGTYYLRTGRKKPYSTVKAASANSSPAVLPQITNLAYRWLSSVRRKALSRILCGKNTAHAYKRNMAFFPALH